MMIFLQIVAFVTRYTVLLPMVLQLAIIVTQGFLLYDELVFDYTRHEFKQNLLE